MTLEEAIAASNISQNLSARLYEFDTLCTRICALTEMENESLTAEGAFSDMSYAVKKNMLLRFFEREANDLLGERDLFTETTLLTYIQRCLKKVHNILNKNTKIQKNIMLEIDRILSSQETRTSCH